MSEVQPPYTVAEVAHMTGFSVPTVIRLFENEPGVLMLRRKTKNGWYRSIRIPRAVYERVLRRDLVRR